MAKVELRRRRETGDVEPKPISPAGLPGRARCSSVGCPGNWSQPRPHPRDEHREAFEEETGVLVSTFTVGRAIAHKSKVAQEREEEARGLWRWLASRFDARRLVFLRTRAGFTPP
jgi:hypothetical protein